MTKILCISDTHSLHNKIPKNWLVDADIIIHSGDISNRGYLQETKQFLEWFSKLDQYTHKIFIAGNHDWCFQTNSIESKELLEKYSNITYLQDSEVIIERISPKGEIRIL